MLDGPIGLTLARWGCVNQPSSTHTPTHALVFKCMVTGFISIQRWGCGSEAQRWSNEVCLTWLTITVDLRHFGPLAGSLAHAVTDGGVFLSTIQAHFKINLQKTTTKWALQCSKVFQIFKMSSPENILYSLLRFIGIYNNINQNTYLMSWFHVSFTTLLYSVVYGECVDLLPFLHQRWLSGDADWIATFFTQLFTQVFLPFVCEGKHGAEIWVSLPSSLCPRLQTPSGRWIGTSRVCGGDSLNCWLHILHSSSQNRIRVVTLDDDIVSDVYENIH